MKTLIISAERWREAVAILHGSGVVGLPTDTVYGIAAMPQDEKAIEAIYDAKGRPADRALPLLVASLDNAEHVARLDEKLRALCARFWPGALTVVADAAASFHSPAAAADGTVALRQPALELALQLIRAAGGVLAVTSANLSGLPPATSALEVIEQLDGRIAAVIDGGPSPGGVASTVVRTSGGLTEILREGAVPGAEIERALLEFR